MTFPGGVIPPVCLPASHPLAFFLLYIPPAPQPYPLSLFPFALFNSLPSLLLPIPHCSPSSTIFFPSPCSTRLPALNFLSFAFCPLRLLSNLVSAHRLLVPLVFQAFICYPLSFSLFQLPANPLILFPYAHYPCLSILESFFKSDNPASVSPSSCQPVSHPSFVPVSVLHPAC